MLGELRTRKLTHFFNVMDHDRDGRVTREDLERVAGNLATLRGLAEDSAEYASFRVGFDSYAVGLLAGAGGPGGLTLDAWLSYNAQLLADEARFEATASLAAAAMFALMDANGDGVINLDEYRQWMSAWGIDPDDHADEVFGKLDLNGDGTLSRGEVLGLVRDFFYSDDPDAPGNWALGPFQ